MRNAILLCLTLACCLALPPFSAASDDIPSVAVPLPGHPAAVERFAAPGSEKRPAVILLPGRQGIEPLREHYRHYAQAVARAGMDAYLVSYYSGSDRERMIASDAAGRQALFCERLGDWLCLIRDAVSLALARKDSSGRVGILGFSQGGFLATAAANQDTRLGALVVFYGGIPSVLRNAITHLPPLLALHGDADTVVPVSEGQALVDCGHELGQPAELVVFPQAGHGFAGKDAAAAERRALSFLRARLSAVAP